MRVAWMAGVAAGAASIALGGTVSVPLSGGGRVQQTGSLIFGLNTGVLAPTTHPTFWATQNGLIYRTWMEFDLSAVPAGATIDTVGFRFWQTNEGATVTIRGGYEPGELSYTHLFGYSGVKEVAGPSLFNATTTEGTVFGGQNLVKPGNGLFQTVSLTNTSTTGGAAGLAYFNANVGNRIMLVGGRTDEAIISFAHNGGGPAPTLEITYTDAPVIPLPHAGGMALAGLGVLALRRRRVRA